MSYSSALMPMFIKVMSDESMGEDTIEEMSTSNRVSMSTQIL